MPDIPEGAPATLLLPFSGIDQYEVAVSTKSEASKADESRVQNLYVMVFDNNKKISDGTYSNSPQKIYGRYFSYDHLKSPEELNASDNECWFVQNKPLINDDESILTKGAVKISTVTTSDAIVVVIANVTNSVTNLDGINALDRLKAVQHYKELKDIQVCLEQDIVNRKDLFLMTGELANVNTRNLMWNTSVGSLEYNDSYTVELKHVDAKVKFRVKINRNNISAAKPVYWQVLNTPDRCYLYTKDGQGNAPEEIDHFSSPQYYFEGTEYEKDSSNNIVKELDPTTGEMVPITYYTFCFYMLENNQAPNGTAEKYYQREVRDKIDSGESGYKGKMGSESGAFGNHYVENGEWKYAPTFGTYVCFDLVLTLTPDGIAEVGNVDSGQLNITQALTSDAIFTVHLGDFANSGDRTLKDGTAISGSQFNNYETKRGHSYTYTITINNTTNIYAEVTNDEEIQAGQEGFLLLTDTEIINADCHYEYHQISFDYRPHLDQNKFSWYVKTPFGEGGPKITKNLATGEFTYDGTGLDYKWVLFGVNKKVLASGDPGYTAPSGSEAEPDPVAWNDFAAGGALVRPYSKKRHAYPGYSHYDPNWKPGQAVSVPCNNPSGMVPDLMDITQLIQYIFEQTKKEDAVAGSSDFIYDSATSTVPVIRVTAFIDEYYYEKDPTNPGATVDPDLWRKFVNANPRELHILSDAKSSRDRKSDVIMSSHSVIQQSIQTIYNIYAADLHSLWGTEHQDEMKQKEQLGWMYWPVNPDSGVTERSGSFSTVTGKENGRLNSAYIWRLYSKQDNYGEDYTAPGYADKKEWATFLNYNVSNNTPELREAYQGMAFSCMTRNRDNNGDGKIDRDEVRWYMAAPNQLIGMWVGNESLSVSARLYRPEKNQWRAHIISSAEKRVCWSEEGGGATQYDLEKSAECWGSYEKAAAGESVRCLRNIGTYTDEETGLTQDITGAPYKVRTERYFTISPEPSENLTEKDSPSTHYVFSFDRLNPKSLRELSEAELPYSDQFSANNCVYLQMETQCREDELILERTGADDPYPGFDYPFDLTMKEINPKVDELGYNPFCPPGYRFPNESENLLMSVYLPESFFTYGATNNESDKLPATWMSTRTYFDRGCYGKNTEGFEFDNCWDLPLTHNDHPIKREQGKVGFGYRTDSKKNSCSKVTFKTTRSRCVRDINRTGDITGGILINSGLYPGDRVPITFSFNSSGASFISASLKFCYTDPTTGIYHERDIPVQTTPAGLQFLADQTVRIPSITEMGIGEMPLSSANPKFKVTLRNAYVSKTFEQPVTLGNPLNGSLVLKDNNELYPSDSKTISFNISTNANSCYLNSVSLKLKYKDKLDADVEKTLTIPAVSPDSLTYKRPNQSIAIPNLSSLNLLAENIDTSRQATLEMTVTDDGGSSKTFVYPVSLDNPLAGSLSVTDAQNDKIYPSDQNHVNLSVLSKANTINLSSVSMSLFYDGGSPVPISIPAIGASAKTYDLASQLITIPDLASLTGVDVAALEAGKAAGVRVTYSAGDYSKTIEKSLTLSHPVVATSFTIDAVDNIKIYPDDQNTVSLDFASLGNTITLSTATLQLYQGASPIGSPIINGVTINDTEYDWSGNINIPSLNDLGLSASVLDSGYPLTLKALVTSSATGLSRSLDFPLTLSNPVSGTMTADAFIYPNDGASVTINFASAAHNLNLDDATLQLYNGGSLVHTFDLTGNLPSGKTYSKTPLALSIPVLSSLDSPLDGTNFAPMDMSLKLTVSSDNDLSYSVEQPVTLRSHIKATHLDIVKNSNTPGFPVDLQAELYPGNSVSPSVSSAVLWWREQGGTWQQHPLSGSTSVQRVITTDDLSGISTFDDSSHSYINYKFVVACSDGTTATTPVWSMKILKYNYTANGSTKWGDTVDNLNFARGDYLEAMLSNMDYSLAKSGVLSLGNRIDRWAVSGDYCFHLYTGNTTASRKLRSNAMNNGSALFSSSVDKDHSAAEVNIYFDKDGLFVDGKEGSENGGYLGWSKTNSSYRAIVTYLGGQTTIEIGQKEGGNRSKSSYSFIRAVRQYEITP